MRGCAEDENRRYGVPGETLAVRPKLPLNFHSWAISRSLAIAKEARNRNAMRGPRRHDGRLVFAAHRARSAPRDKTCIEERTRKCQQPLGAHLHLRLFLFHHPHRVERLRAIDDGGMTTARLLLDVGMCIIGYCKETRRIPSRISEGT